MLRRRDLDNVFTMAPKPNKFTYVDRGHLDRKVRSALRSGTHVAMHGESKHGKSWLRAKTLPEKTIARVQCMPGMRASTVIEEALGTFGVYETVRLVTEDSIEATVKSSVTADARVLGAAVEQQLKAGNRQTLEQVPVGQGRGSLWWVSQQLLKAKRTPVFEDFHNLSTDAQIAMAYAIKALGEWHVPCVVVGIWTDTHLLKLYNGELDGRIVDLKLKWTFEELKQVVQKGCDALNVDIDDGLCKQLVRDSYTSVGLLQELTEATLAEAGIGRRSMRRQTVADSEATKRARASVVAQISTRFDPFVQLFPRADVDGVAPGLYPSLIGALLRVPEKSLLDGLSVSELHSELSIENAALTEEEVVFALVSLEEAHQSVGIRPSVLAYDAPRGRLILADRRFLLYLRERTSA